MVDSNNFYGMLLAGVFNKKMSQFKSIASLHFSPLFNKRK